MDEELDTLVFNVKSKRPVLASDEDATEIMEEESRTTRRNSVRRYTHQEIKVNLPKGAKYDEYAALYSHVEFMIMVRMMTIIWMMLQRLLVRSIMQNLRSCVRRSVVIVRSTSMSELVVSAMYA